MSRLSFRSEEENSCVEFVGVQVGSIASEARCVNFSGWNTSAEGEGAWVYAKEAGEVAWLVFDLGNILTVSRVDLILDASAPTKLQVDVKTATKVKGARGFVKGEQVASKEWAVEGKEGGSMYLSKGGTGGGVGGLIGVASRYWRIDTNNTQGGNFTPELRIRGVKFWYWRSVLDQQVQGFRVE